MPLEEPTRRLALSVQPDLERMVDRERLRAARGEQVIYDAFSRMATWQTRRGEIIGRWYGEVLAAWVVRDRFLRWTWTSRPSSASEFGSVAGASHAEVVSREGEERGVPQLAMGVVADLDEDEAITLARLGVVVARGEGLEIRRNGAEIELVGLFDAPRPRAKEADPSRYSVPPPPVTRSSSPPGARGRSTAPGASRSSPPAPPYGPLPPIREIFGPPSRRRSSPPPRERRIREPARVLFLPVASMVLDRVAKAAPGYQQALFVLAVDRRAPRDPRDDLRLSVQLVVLDASSALRAIDLPGEIVASAARLVEADHDDGNGPWRKLSARITPKPDGGATLNVDVV